MLNSQSKILIVGHNDIIERGLFAHLTQQGYSKTYSSSMIGLNCAVQSSVYAFFQETRPEYIFLSSVRSGGIQANQTYPADFIHANLEAQNNVLYASWKFEAKKVLFIGSSCVYPKDAQQPITEDSLLTGALEGTSEPYAVAKIAGIKMCQAYRKQYGLNAIAAIPASIYGPGLNTDEKNAHVLGALLKKFVDAVEEDQEKVQVWGSGKPRREFLYLQDFIDACLFLMNEYDDSELINIGTGTDVTIQELAELIAKVTGFEDKIQFDASRSDGVMRKLLDHQKIEGLGWNPKVSLEQGLQKTYEWYLERRKATFVA
jgi:GDP-L-fucose synthase